MMVRKGRKRKIGVRITLAGSLPKRVDIAKAKATRRAARERKARRPPVEDDRVAKAWDRAERTHAARAEAMASLKAAKSIPPIAIETKKITDPYEPKDFLFADVNVHESPVEWLFARRRITQLQYTVASRFRSIYERSTIGNVQAIDYEKPMVEGAVPGDVFTDEFVAANIQVKAVTRELGRVSADLMVRIAGVGEKIESIASVYAQPGLISARLAQGYVTMRFREALDTLADFWGLTKAVGPNRARGGGGLIGAPLVPGRIDYDEEVQARDLRSA